MPRPPNPEGAPDSGDDGLIVVGVGASAGGLEAFTDLLRHLPPVTGMAFVLVQHLDPHHESALTELLAGKTRMPVLQVQNDTPIQPDHVYVIPPNNLMLVRDGSLVLSARPVTLEGFKPIDAFFNSLASEFRVNAVGVVLSGTASDGTLGLKTIKAEGGITFAQNQTAKFDSMPRSAVAAGVVDFILSPRRIAEELVALTHRTRHLRKSERDLADDGTTLQRVLAMLRNHTGVDFAQYKQPTILRRIDRRMVVRRSENLEQYFELLQKEPQELKALFDDVLINVTDFFRDPDVFEAAKRIAFPALLCDRKPPYAVRAWIPGCSSGEEVYSLAIALVEYLESEDLECRIRLFGTDISDTVIDKARAGIYDESSMLNVSPERLRRFFVRTDSGYQISRAIRETCVFSRHNVAKDPPLSRMDLISCRNLLIYLAPSLQRRIVATFGYALRPGGCLILGSSETLGSLSDHFLTLDEPHKIYSRKPDVSLEAFRLSEGLSEAGVEFVPPFFAGPATSRQVETADRSSRLEKYINTIVLSQYGPAGLVADDRLRIVEYRGDVAQFLAEKEMPRDAELMSALPEKTRAPLSTAIEQARRTEVAVVAENVPNPGGQGSGLVSVTVVPLALAGNARHFLILFRQAREETATLEVPGPSSDIETESSPLAEENSRLKQELKTTREYLQSLVEELRSANEEAQSANEELQSTNEEIQTSKEELQSANEELNTINAEMQSRNADLARVNDDLINLFASMNMPIVMTGSDLCIRRFTPTAEKVLRLIPTDVGRPIADLKPRINVPDLEEILQQVVDTLQPHEQEVQDEEGRLYLMRVRPYRTVDNRIDGTVLQLLDVSELKRTLEDARHARDFAEAIVNTVREPLVVLDQHLAVQNANPAFYDALSLSQGAALGQSIYEVARGRFDMPKVRDIFSHLGDGTPQVNDVEIELQSERGEVRILSLNARRLLAPGPRQLVLVTFADITERKRAAEARYRRLFESARDGILMVDAATGEVMDLNPFAERLFGYPRAEIVGCKLWEIGPMRHMPRARAAFEQIRDQGVQRFDDLNMRTKDGHEILAEVIANVYSEGDRRAIQFNIRDVSERKKFERELQETQKLESLGLLAGGIAHDFNNLLTGIIGNASMALSDLPVNDPLRIRIRDVVRAGERAAFLTRQMLAYAGKGRLVSERFHVGELVSEISALIRTSIPKTVELKLNIAPNLPMIEADSSQIQQVIMNLVINGAEAIGANATGQVNVRISAREIDAHETPESPGQEGRAPGTYVQIEVADTGSGMDEATKARIFDPFFTTKFTGRGLGLAAVHGIVKRHGGSIRVYSTPGQGTTFVVLLPASRHKPRAAAPPEKHRPLSIPPGSVALVIDDEETIRSLAERVLARAGMKVLTAENGKIGAEMFRDHHAIISVVILDFLMPVMGGAETLALLKQINPAIPVILSSGFDESEAARRFSEPAPAHLLQKPYTSERLVEAVGAALNR